MHDGLAVVLFYLIVGGVWVFVKLTNKKERQSMLEWSLIAVAIFGTVGFLFELTGHK